MANIEGEKKMVRLKLMCSKSLIQCEIIIIYVNGSLSVAEPNINVNQARRSVREITLNLESISVEVELESAK